MTTKSYVGRWAYAIEFVCCYATQLRGGCCYVVACLYCLILLGCTSNATRLDVRPVQGKLFVGKTPAVGAMVVFHPLAKQDERAVPRGKVGEDGSFKLSTYNADDGAPLGKYKVTIDWRKTNTIDPNDNGTSLVPAIYTRPDSTPLEVEITAATDVLEPFVLTK